MCLLPVNRVCKLVYTISWNIGRNVAAVHKKIDQKLAARLRAARRAAGLSEAELANKVSLSADRLIALERGDSRIDAHLMTKVSIALGIEISWFFDNSPCRSQTQMRVDRKTSARVLPSNMVAQASPALKALIASTTRLE